MPTTEAAPAWLVSLPACIVQVCGVTCCGAANFEQHCLSRRHQRKVASAESAYRAGGGAGDLISPPMGAASISGEPASAMTYVGPQAQSRNYCQQVVTRSLMLPDLHSTTFLCRLFAVQCLFRCS